MLRKIKEWKRKRRNIKIAKKIIQQEQWHLDMIEKINNKKHEVWNLKWKLQDDPQRYFILEKMEEELNNLEKKIEEEF